MIRQPMLRRGGIGRLTIAVIGAAVLPLALLLAPAAAAQPDVEAGDAITAAWQNGGGDTGPLGPKQGDVYPIGAGFAQNFASGKAFFTPATGAHLMQGTILDTYEAMGGPADSDLGFPTIDEGDGRAPGSRNVTFSASDNPVIFWTPDTGAHVVRGAINAAWDRLGGSAGTLGVPSEDETYNGSVVAQTFTGGQLSYDARTKTFSTVPPDLADQLAGLTVSADPVAAINTARRAAGGPLGPLGAPSGQPYPIGADGYGQDFVNGKIFYRPDTGANVVTGQVLAKYESVGGPQGDLGFPITGEVDGGLPPASRMSSFAAPDKPVIFWTPDYGAVIVRGAMNAAWSKLGGATGTLGAPTADQTRSGDVITQKFSGGAVSYDTAAKKFSTEPSNLAPQLIGVAVPGGDEPAAQAPQASGGGSGSGWTWLWLLAIIPVVLLIGVVAFAVVRNRRRGRDIDPFDTDDDDDVEPVDVRPHGAVREDDEDLLFGDRYAREGLGSLSAVPGSVSGQSTGEAIALDFWGAPADDSPPDDSPSDERAVRSDGFGDEDEDPDAIDTAPTRVPSAAELTDAGMDRHHDADDESTSYRAEEPAPDGDDGDNGAESHGTEHLEAGPATGGAVFGAAAAGVAAVPARDPLTDTGRHARIDPDQPMPLGTALHMPYDDPQYIPDGYPVKADTRSGLYWTPDSADYTDAPVEVWFASEEIARTNGFIRGE